MMSWEVKTKFKMEIVAEESKFFSKKLEENRTQTVFKSNEMEIDYFD